MRHLDRDERTEPTERTESAAPPARGVFAAAHPCPVMSFNLKFGTYELNPWDKRAPIMLRLLQRYRPLFLGTQETLGYQIEDLLRGLEGYASIGVSRQGTDEDEYSALLYDARVAELLDTGTFWLSETPDVPGSLGPSALHPRIATWGEFRVAGASERTYVFNTHLSFLDQAALRNAQVLLEEMERLVVGGEVVVTGDFNVPRGGPVWRLFQKAGFRDAWQLAERSAGPGFTFHDWQGESAGLDDRIIDWILYRPPSGGAAAPPSLRVEVIADSENGIYPSDHFPVALLADGAPDRGE